MVPPTVGIIANPVSARDIRRIVAHAGNLQITDRANIVLRILAGLAYAGVENVVMMPDRAGVRTYIERGLRRAASSGEGHFPALSFLDMPVMGTADDTVRAARIMRKQDVSAIVVLGGDGTHRLVVRECGNIPISGVSSGTNNAFPTMAEPTITGLATGLSVRGLIPPSVAFFENKLLECRVNDLRDIALVDIAVVSDLFTGAKAVWRSGSLKELFTAFAFPHAIGLSAISGLLSPVNREAPEGRQIRLKDSTSGGVRLDVPLAPGLMAPVYVSGIEVLTPDNPASVCVQSGALALDGEREHIFNSEDHVTVTLRTAAFKTIDTNACMHYAADKGLFTRPVSFEPEHASSVHNVHEQRQP